MVESLCTARQALPHGHAVVWVEIAELKTKYAVSSDILYVTLISERKMC